MVQDLKKQMAMDDADLFAALDVNQDGSISYDEFYATVNSLKVNEEALSKREREADVSLQRLNNMVQDLKKQMAMDEADLFAALDVNQDGSISYDEFYAAVNSLKVNEEALSK